jgi:hypothetical protein
MTYFSEKSGLFFSSNVLVDYVVGKSLQIVIRSKSNVLLNEYRSMMCY